MMTQPIAIHALKDPETGSLHRTNATVVMTMTVTSTITCPFCGGRATEMMPTDACRVFYTCRHCGTMLRPHPGDCCVFCSYGSVPCPPKQAEVS